ncbi:MAG: hypothetical protein DI552_00150 [Brevundimonas sp.]|uniref:hypothetical protein n=1 Tax=Brevundimonas sp. TaxID=1871086 RepID=UPI000DBBF1F3|nr:hypothetical protein [Brevundimonas sp.]PZU62316.1 MAG: hypothetical protein DI552_00150 [Brevundimonas sp.]
MFQLAAPQHPEWLDLAPGIRGRFRVGPSEAIVFARRFSRRAVEADDRTDPQFAFVVGCVVWGLVEWDGIGHPAPTPPDDVLNGPADALAAWREANPPPPGVADLNADNVTALLRHRPDIYDKVDRTYVDSIMRAAAEKNASGSSPSGTSAGGKPSVTPAATAPSAPIAKTTRARKRASGSGPSSKAAPAS